MKLAAKTFRNTCFNMLAVFTLPGEFTLANMLIKFTGMPFLMRNQSNIVLLFFMMVQGVKRQESNREDYRKKNYNMLKMLSDIPIALSRKVKDYIL